MSSSPTDIELSCVRKAYLVLENQDSHSVDYTDMKSDFPILAAHRWITPGAAIDQNSVYSKILGQ